MRVKLELEGDDLSFEIDTESEPRMVRIVARSYSSPVNLAAVIAALTVLRDFQSAEPTKLVAPPLENAVGQAWPEAVLPEKAG